MRILLWKCEILIMQICYLVKPEMKFKKTYGIWVLGTCPTIYPIEPDEKEEIPCDEQSKRIFLKTKGEKNTIWRIKCNGTRNIWWHWILGKPKFIRVTSISLRCMIIRKSCLQWARVPEFSLKMKLKYHQTVKIPRIVVNGKESIQYSHGNLDKQFLTYFY